MQTFAYLGGGIGRFYADIIYDSSRKCATMDPTDDTYLSVALQSVLLDKFVKKGITTKGLVKTYHTLIL